MIRSMTGFGSAEIERDGQTLRIGADTFVVSCGAVNSTALLLRSASSLHPNGLANSSGLVGRNYMVHNNTALMAVNPFRINPTTFQKTMAVNDFYLRGDEGYRFPLGNLQLLGKLQAGMLTANQRWVPKPILSIRPSERGLVGNVRRPARPAKPSDSGGRRQNRSSIPPEQSAGAQPPDSSGHPDVKKSRLSYRSHSTHGDRDQFASVWYHEIWN